MTKLLRFIDWKVIIMIAPCVFLFSCENEEGGQDSNSRIQSFSCDELYDQVEIIKDEVIAYFPELENCEGKNCFPSILNSLMNKGDLESFSSLPCGCSDRIFVIKNLKLTPEGGKLAAMSMGRDEEKKSFFSKNLKFKTPPPGIKFKGVHYLKIEDESVDLEPDDSSLTVSIIDTGIDIFHEALRANFWASNIDNCLGIKQIGFDFPRRDTNIIDTIGHGTHIAGIITRKFEDEGVDGLRLLNFKISQGPPNSTNPSLHTMNLSSALCAIESAKQFNIRIVNMSWGYYAREMDSLLYTVVKEADSTTLFITSAGNMKVDTDICNHYPSHLASLLPNVISVGAYDQNTASIADFSNFGENTVDVLAPGVNIESTFPQNDIDNKSGTSMAAAFVSGLAASIFAKNPNLYPEDVKKIITSMAADNPSNVVKYGILTN